MIAKAVLVVIGSWWARWLSGGRAGGLARRLRAGSALWVLAGAHLCQTADLTKVVVVEQCYGGVDGQESVAQTTPSLQCVVARQARWREKEMNVMALDLREDNWRC